MSPNIILISLDTLRADRLSCYGYGRPTSPHLDKVAAQGALFTQFYSPHIPTFPGHTTMHTGRDIYVHQVTGQSGSPEPDANIPMLAEMLKSRGYYTAAADNLGRWFTRGFDLYQTYTWDTRAKHAWRKGEAVAQAALTVVNSAAGQNKPFFLFLHYWDPHTPYLPPEPFSRMFYEGDERDPANRSMDRLWAFENFKWYFNEWMPGVTDIEFPKAQYDAEVAYMDACLGHLFTRLRELKLEDDTLVIVTADHGEELDEHGCWFDHHGLYEANIHIPLIVRLPGRVTAGTRISGLARMHDLVPTVLDYAGLLDPAMQFEGRSLRPLIPAKPGHVCTHSGTVDALYLTENTWMKKRALRTHTWKLITALEPDIHGFDAVELYDLCTDPGETVNLATVRPDITRALTAQLTEHVHERCSRTGNPDPLPLQPIPLTRIGKMETAVPRDPEVAPPEPAADKKLEEGDFVGYERGINEM